MLKSLTQAPTPLPKELAAPYPLHCFLIVRGRAACAAEKRSERWQSFRRRYSVGHQAAKIIEKERGFVVYIAHDRSERRTSIRRFDLLKIPVYNENNSSRQHAEPTASRRIYDKTGHACADIPHQTLISFLSTAFLGQQHQQVWTDACVS